MSSILEALKKLDRERSVRKNGVINIEREILQSPLPNESNKKRYLTLFLVLLGTLVVLSFVLVWYWWQPLSKEKDFSGNAKIRQKIAVQATPATGRLPVPQPPAQTPDSQPKSQQPPQETASPQPHRAETPPATSPRPFQPAPQPKPFAATPPVKAAPAPGPSLMRKQQQSQSRPLPTLTVSGIAYGESRKARLAIVNSQPVTIGDSIEGVKIEDISEEAVHFSREEEKFILGIGESTRK
ncbi:MAG: general secretion pathway protein GspB [Deltaproteobacteria bacterium]|nr:general secretion pathway protein GspB [Deltaproteobacteria bacterium]